MRAYGHNRFDMVVCKWGCCTTKSGKMKNCRDAVDRQNRKTARQQSKRQVFAEVSDLCF